jgi:recombinational DNA repair protein (RecF pathway)
MHTIHHTRAIIIKSQSSGEANKLFWFFTQELGLIVAVATGVRKGEAKLKGQLVDYTVVDVDLVQGRDVWRLISATLLINPLRDKIKHPLARPYVRTLATLERFLIDDGEQRELFDHIEECAMYLAEAPASVDPKSFDTLSIWRTLVHLGYIAVAQHEKDLFILPFDQAVRLLDPTTTTVLVAMVNTTIKETHL